MEWIRIGGVCGRISGWREKEVKWKGMRSTFFFNDTATTEIYTLSLHDALPIALRAAPPMMWNHPSA